MSTNLPPQNQSDSATKMKIFFDNYYTQQISFPAEEVDSVIDYFTKRGFDYMASTAVTTVILQQAYTDNVDVFAILDTLHGLTEVQLSAIVADILNSNRQRTSMLGYRQPTNPSLLESRNIII